MFYWLLYIAVMIFFIAAQWRMVEKAGYPGISQIIPIWNVVVMVKMAGYSGWAFFILLIPVVNVVFAIIMNVRMCTAFGRGGGFILLYIFLPFIAIPILGFGDDEYNEALIA